MTDLQELQRAIRKWDAVIEAEFEKFQNATTGYGVEPIRCAADHRSKRPVLAQIYSAGGTMLFVSRIAWQPVDLYGPVPPWQRRAVIAQAQAVSAEDALAAWDRGPRGVDNESGERWLQAVPEPWMIREVLTADGDQLGRPELWTRCPDHLADAHQHDRLALVTAGRRASRMAPKHLQDNGKV